MNMFNDSQLTRLERDLAEQRGDLQKNMDDERRLRSDHDSAIRKINDDTERKLQELDRENAKCNKKISELERDIEHRKQELQREHDRSQANK